MKEGSIGNRGQSALELLIALTILALSISTVIVVAFSNQSVSVDSARNNQAVYLARENLETVRGQARQDFNSVTSNSSANGPYLQETIVQNIDPYTKKVTSRISWTTEPLRPQKIELVTILTDWQNVMSPPDPADSGGGGISGDWKNPRTLGSVDLGPGNSATDLDVISKIVYISAEASAAAKPDFFIIDATDGQNPFIVSSLNTGPSLNSVDASGNYAYVANKETDAELQVINVSNVGSPSLAASYGVPGVSGSSEGTAVFYSNSKVYLTMNKADGPEFHVIDVSNPTSPSLLGSFEVDDNVNDVYVRGDRAYLATDLGSAGLVILDVSNPASITLLGQGYSGDTNSAANINDSLTVIGPAQDFYTIDTTNPADITTLGSLNVGDVMNDLYPRDYLAFIATSNSNREFQVINIASSTDPTLWSYFNFPQVATGIDYEDNIVYVSVRSNDALRIIVPSP